VTAPILPGRYKAVCIVICSDGHEGMGFTLVVSKAAAR
jgi:heme/copper-type cytochrome/quinol oxidase subunit 2